MNSTQDSTATQKSLFARYQEHITRAIFIGLVLGILTGLFLASRFDVVLTVTTLLGSIYMKALNKICLLYTSYQVPNLREYDSGELLKMEKEVSGLYLSGHPLDAYRRCV